MSLGPSRSSRELMDGLYDYRTQEVTETAYKARREELLAQVKKNPGQLILTRLFRLGKTWGYSDGSTTQLGVIKSGIEDKHDPLFGVEVTESAIVYRMGHIREQLRGIGIGHEEIMGSFSTQMRPLERKEDWMHLPQEEWPISCFQMVIGNQAIAEWLTSRGNAKGRELPTEDYFKMAKILGVEPIRTPETDAYLEQQKLKLIAQLASLAFKQIGLQKHLDTIYASIGKDILAAGGGAIAFAPESRGEANLMTGEQRQVLDKTTRKINAIKAELVDLGIDQAQYYEHIAHIFGLQLPEQLDDDGLTP